MMARCAQGYDAERVMRAVAGDLTSDETDVVMGHAAQCAVCSARLRSRRLAKQGWSDLVAESPAIARTRDRRAARIFEHAREGRGTSPLRSRLVLGLAALGACAAVAFAWLHGERANPPLVSASPAVVASVVASAASPGARPDRALAPPTLPPPSTGRHPMTLEETGGVDVPSGARLSLSFSVAEAPEDAGATLRAEVEGPARALSDGKGGLRLEYGRAKLVAAGAGAMTTPFATFSTLHGRWTVDVNDTGTRVFVESARLEAITSSGAKVTLGAGDHLAIDAHGGLSLAAAKARPAAPLEAATAPAAASPSSAAEPAPVVTPEQRLSAARQAMEAGDRALAEQELRTLLGEVGPSHSLVGRASFFLAELLLARGDTLGARSRLQPLVSGNDPALAQDAATLLARSSSTRGERH